MKYIKQFSIILLISFLGEALHALLPLPIPASIYGIVLLFAALVLKIIPVSAVKDVSTFLLEIMPMLFIPAAAGLPPVHPKFRWPEIWRRLPGECSPFPPAGTDARGR